MYILKIYQFKILQSPFYTIYFNSVENQSIENILFKYLKLIII